MNLALDIGNTAVKWATFEGHTLVERGTGIDECGKWGSVTSAMACASGDLSKYQPMLDTFDFQLSIFNTSLPLPLRLDYKTPDTLGADRLAAACGAWALHPGEDSLVIDAGTCITVDFVSADGTYHGGAIMPGLQMNLRALHTFTARLPVISLDGVDKAPVLGRSTEESIVAGTLGATMLALAGYVTLYRQRCPSLHVLLTGGDADRLTAAGASGWELQPHLTLTGLNELMEWNKEK